MKKAARPPFFEAARSGHERNDEQCHRVDDLDQRVPTGPAVSLYGSPTVSPVTAACGLPEPLPPKLPSSMYFLALSQAPTAGGHGDGHEEARDDGTYQQNRPGPGTEDKADNDGHRHRQDGRNHHLLDGGHRQHVHSPGIIGLGRASMMPAIFL